MKLPDCLLAGTWSRWWVCKRLLQQVFRHHKYEHYSHIGLGKSVYSSSGSLAPAVPTLPLFLQHLAVVWTKETILSPSVSRYALAGTMQGAECHLITFTERSNTVPLTHYLFRNTIAHFKISYLGTLQHIFK